MTAINVLVVDDFPQNLVANEAILARPGLTILKAASGNEALELLLTHEIALALVDVQMPGMDGFELAEIMRASPRTAAIPIIFLTAAAEEATRSFRGYQAGAVDFLNKPIHPDILRGKVEVFVQLQEQKNQIRQQVAELRQSLQMNELFIAVLGHDLRNPLSAVQHGAELVRMLSGGEKRLVAAASRISASAARMDAMVRQLLDVAQSRSGTLALTLSAGDLGEVCKRIIDEIAHRADDSRIRVETEGVLEAQFDADRISQVVSNLVGNALQHGQPHTPVLLRLDGSHPQRVVMHVINEGVIPADALGTIFEPFQIPQRERAPTAGLGLGLYIVQQFVAAHGGTVRVSSSQETGRTAFEVVLPRTVAARD